MKPRYIKDFRSQKSLESRVVRITKLAAKRAGFLHRKVKYAGRNGAPDDWFFGFDGKLIIIEFKASNKKPRANQIVEIAELRKRGFDVRVIDNEADGAAVFEGVAQW